MFQLNSPMEIYKLLPKSNCRKCQVPSCLAFAAAVINSQKRLQDCPHLESDIIQRYEVKDDQQVMREQQIQEALEQWKKKVAAIDFHASVQRLGASLDGDKLKIKCLGKDFMVDTKGNITSGCHVNAWLTRPLLEYIIYSAGKDISEKWVSFRELENGETWYLFFKQRCETPLKRIVDTHLDLFKDLIYIFNGRPVATSFFSDISFVLHPLPKVPMLISYIKPEEDFESQLKVFFDVTAQENLPIESLYVLGAGIAIMLEKITSRHG